MMEKEIVLFIYISCKDRRFPVFASCVKILNPDLLTSCETGLNPVVSTAGAQDEENRK
jgi:hypothetical protein